VREGLGKEGLEIMFRQKIGSEPLRKELSDQPARVLKM